MKLISYDADPSQIAILQEILHQNYFYLSLSDLSLENYYNKFKGVCEELKIYQPVSFDVKTMKK